MIVYDNAEPKQDKPTNPNIMPPDYRGITVESRNINRKDIIAEIGGRPWIVQYYSSYLNADNQTAPLATNRLAPYQQYMKVIDLEIKVNRTYEYEVDSGSKEAKLTGAATMYPGMVPQKGDVFIADIGNGYSGIFLVTDAQPKAHFQETVYAIEYVLRSYSNPEELNDLAEKTQKVTYFVKRLIQNGQRGILIQEEFDLYTNAVKLYSEFSRNYFSDFFNREYSTFTVPGQSKSTYDQYAIKAIMAVFAMGEVQDYDQVKILNTVDGYEHVTTTVWDALLTMDPTVLYRCESLLSVTDVGIYHAYSMYQNIRWSGIKQVVYPVNRESSSHSQLVTIPKPIYTALEPSRAVKTNRPLGLDALIANDCLDGFGAVPPDQRSPPAIWPVTKDEHYIFSKAFYSGRTEEMSQVELMLEQCFKNQPLAGHDLLGICRASRLWGDVERFYYTPVLALLIVQFIRRL